MARVFEREKSWWIDFKDQAGIRHRRKVGPSKRIAKEVLDGLLGNAARRVHLGVIEDSKISFGEFAAIWLERVKPALRPRTRERWAGIIEQHLKPSFRGSLRAVAAPDA